MASFLSVRDGDGDGDGAEGEGAAVLLLFTTNRLASVLLALLLAPPPLLNVNLDFGANLAVVWSSCSRSALSTSAYARWSYAGK